MNAVTALAAARPKRVIAALAIGLPLLLAGCEDRMMGDLMLPKPKPDRVRPVAAAPVVARSAATGYWIEPSRANCAPSRC